MESNCWKDSVNICSIEGCGKPVKARGWCGTHHERNRRNGDPNKFLREEDGELLEYLKAHMYDGCSTEWPFFKSKGYGAVTFKGKRQFAHVVSFMIGNNFIEISKGMVVRHLCNKGNEGCFNFACLELGTKRDDAQDRIKAGTWSHGEKHGRAKLSNEDVVEIRRLYATGNYTQQQLADMFNVSGSHISLIVNFKIRRNG
jgi:hypothetical protein